MSSSEPITVVDTFLGGWDGVMAAYLVTGDQPALVDPGAQTSVDTVRNALSARGLGAADLAWIVLTHIHLDHCGGTGDLALAFPHARVVVHPRGARHLVEPQRLIEGSWAVFGDRAEMHGGLTPTDAARIVTADDGMRIPIGPGRDLIVAHAPGHAHHHMVLIDEATGAVMAGDALGVQFPGSALYPAVPPPQFDLDATLATLDHLEAIRPTTLLLGHFGAVDDPETAVATSRERQSRLAHAALRGWARGGTEGVAAAIAQELPVDAVVTDEAGHARWQRMDWAANNVGGLAGWAERAAHTPNP